MAQRPTSWDRPPMGGGPSFGGFEPPPPDILFLLAALFVSFSLSAFEGTAILVLLLQLTPALWKLGFVWQLLTYPLAAEFSGFFFLLALFMVYQFGSAPFRRLGRKEFWKVFLLATVLGGAAAVATQLVLETAGLAQRADFVLMQGERMTLAVVTALFATLFAHQTILFFFILPIPARALLWIELVLAFVAFLATKDFAGFVGIAAGVGTVWFWLTGRGPRRLFAEWERRYQVWRTRRRYEKLKKKSGMRVVGKDDRWVN
jgi:hypothetical protein